MKNETIIKMVLSDIITVQKLKDHSILRKEGSRAEDKKLMSFGWR